jgi:hypothetical protein
MKNSNDENKKANLPGVSGNEKVFVKATNISECNSCSKEQLKPETDRKSDWTREEDDLMRRGDFRYFYSGRKLL